MNLQINAVARMGGEAFNAGKSFDLDAFAANYGGVTVSRFKAGAVLYSQGDPADAMYYLQGGQIQMTVVSSRGKEGILGVLDAGSFCGEGCLLGNRKVRVATAACMTNTTAARLERASIVRAFREDPAIAELFVVVALKKVVLLRESLISQLFDSSERRLARALLLLAKRGGNGGTKNIVRNIDQEALAQLIGTTRSRVNHFMNKFRRLGYIDYEGSVIVVRDSLSNVARSEEQDGASAGEIAMACLAHSRSPNFKSGARG